MTSERLQPAFWGGLFIGVLSALPLVGAGNCCCCLWVLTGGALATYLRQQTLPTPIDAAEAALVGLLAGVFGGLVGGVLSIPVQMFFGPWQRNVMDWLIAQNPDLPSQIRDAVEQSAAGAVGVIAHLTGILISIVIDAVFGMLGGLLGVAIFKKNTPTPPPPGTVEILPPA
jgi:hypothetical protein